MSSRNPTTARCLGLVSTAFIAPDGGRSNIAAKTLATLWYILIVPDAQSRLHRHLHHRRVPWHAPSRIFGIVLAAANIVTMPLSWSLLFAGKRNASRLAALGVLFNPPSIQLSTLLITELSAALFNQSCRLARGVKTIATKPFKCKKEDDQQEHQTPASNAQTDSTPKPSTDANPDLGKSDASPSEDATQPSPAAETAEPSPAAEPTEPSPAAEPTEPSPAAEPTEPLSAAPASAASSSQPEAGSTTPSAPQVV